MQPTDTLRAIFPSKRGLWISAMIWGGAAGAVAGGIAQFAAETSISLKLLTLVGFVAIAFFMLWVLYGTNYGLTQSHIIIRCGPFVIRVPLSEITSVKHSRNPLSSPACSLDRLLIKWGSKDRQILISPNPKSEFLHQLAARCPQLKPVEDGLISVEKS